MSDAPERIWLQWEDHAGENTWCADQINDEDAEYIRADLHAAEVEALRKENERLRRAGDTLSICAQTTGGTAGPDAGLIEAIKKWERARAVLQGKTE